MKVTVQEVLSGSGSHFEQLVVGTVMTKNALNDNG